MIEQVFYVLGLLAVVALVVLMVQQYHTSVTKNLKAELKEQQKKVARLTAIADEQGQALTDYLNAMQEINMGGIYKRIFECREIAAAILDKEPNLYNKEPGLIHWLGCMDLFLVRVALVYARALPNDYQLTLLNVGNRLEESNSIYADVVSRVNLPAPVWLRNSQDEMRRAAAALSLR